jgi:hypothetical protein
MGYGMYTSADWQKLRKSRGVDNSKNEKDIFTKTECDPRFDPQFITKRESRDSADHPESLPIIIGLDVTGSMGYLSYNIATTSLHETMMKLFSTGAVKDPQIMFAAYGDYSDRAPLQVTQFESDIRIAEQLMAIWLENCGSGMVVPQLLWHFAATRTSTDNYEKRHKKGFIFTIGDNADVRTCTAEIKQAFKRVMNENVLDCSLTHILNNAKKQFEIFHIVLTHSTSRIPSDIAAALPGHVMVLDPANIDCIPELLISTIQLVNGGKAEEIVKQWEDLKQNTILSSLEMLHIPTGGKLQF